MAVGQGRIVLRGSCTCWSPRNFPSQAPDPSNPTPVFLGKLCFQLIDPCKCTSLRCNTFSQCTTQSLVPQPASPPHGSEQYPVPLVNLLDLSLTLDETLRSSREVRIVLALHILPAMKGQHTLPEKSAQLTVGEKREDGNGSTAARSNVQSNSTTRVRVSTAFPSTTNNN